MSGWTRWLAEAEARRAAQPINAADLPAREAWHDEVPELWPAIERLRDAPIVWGAACVASRFLQQPGDAATGRGNIVYSADPEFAFDPRPIDRMAQRLGDAFGDENGPPFLDVWRRRAFRDEPTTALPLPDIIAGPHAAFICQTMLIRAHLPAGQMRFDVLPVLALPEPDSPIMVLPASRWPTEMRERWAAACIADRERAD